MIFFCVPLFLCVCVHVVALCAFWFPPFCVCCVLCFLWCSFLCFLSIDRVHVFLFSYFLWFFDLGVNLLLGFGHVIGLGLGLHPDLDRGRDFNRPGYLDLLILDLLDEIGRHCFELRTTSTCCDTT